MIDGSQPPGDAALKAAGVNPAELRDLSVHARERVARAVMDVCGLASNPSTMTGVAMGALGGLYDVMAAMVKVFLAHSGGPPVTDAQGCKVGAALMILQLRVGTGTPRPAAYAEFHDTLRRLGRPDLIDAISLDGF
jgi:hypothetical protein